MKTGRKLRASYLVRRTCQNGANYRKTEKRRERKDLDVNTANVAGTV